MVKGLDLQGSTSLYMTLKLPTQDIASQCAEVPKALRYKVFVMDDRREYEIGSLVTSCFDGSILQKEFHLPQGWSAVTVESHVQKGNERESKKMSATTICVEYFCSHLLIRFQRN